MTYMLTGGTQTEPGQMYDSECSRYRGRFYGPHKAQVVDNLDPLKLNRICVVVPKVLGVDKNDQNICSVWALPKTALGGLPDVGAAMVPDVGAWVWVEFEEGLPSKPLYTGGWNSGPDAEKSQVPFVFKAEGEGDQTPATDKGDDSFSRALGGTSTEPAAPYAAEYPFNRGMKTKAGHLIEIDDTEGEERIHVWHRSGSFVEFHEDGSVVWRMKDGRRYTLVGDDDDLHVQGDRHEGIDGDHTTRRDGDRKIQTGKSHEETIATTRQTTVGSHDTEAVSGNQTQTVGGNLIQAVSGLCTKVSGGAMTFSAPIIKLN